jgi:hypothetical protein
MLDVLAEDGSLATLAAQRTRYVWPEEYDLRRIPIRDPVLIYPQWLIFQAGNPHPGLKALRDFLPPVTATPGAWVPSWAASSSAVLLPIDG